MFFTSNESSVLNFESLTRQVFFSSDNIKTNGRIMSIQFSIRVGTVYLVHWKVTKTLLMFSWECLLEIGKRSFRTAWKPWILAQIYMPNVHNTELPTFELLFVFTQRQFLSCFTLWFFDPSHHCMSLDKSMF